MKRKDKYIRKLVDPGIPYVGEVAGAAIACTVGFFVLGPAGAAVGAAGGKMVTDLLSRAGEEIEKKYLSRRESARIGVSAIYAMNRIKTNFENNIQIRMDDFFVRDLVTDRSAADEILEGTLIAAKNEHEEKKLYYYGNLFGNIAFHPEINRFQADYLLRIAERLSYRQICILALIERKSNYHLSTNSEFSNILYRNDSTLLEEIDEMMTMNLLWSSRPSIMGGRNLTPGEIVMKDSGKTLHSMMNLDEIKSAEIDTLATILSDNA